MVNKFRWVISVVSLFLGCSSPLKNQHFVASPLLGPFVFELNPESAIIWSQSDQESSFEISLFDSSKNLVKKHNSFYSKKTNYTSHIHFNKLKPGESYRGVIRVKQFKKSFSFKTPDKKGTRSVTFAWSGDVGGQNVCRHKTEGYRLFEAITRHPMDFFIGLGDMVYADGKCRNKGYWGQPQIPGKFGKKFSKKNFSAHWRYNLRDRHFNTLLSNVPYFAVGDDHEIINDYGPKTNFLERGVPASSDILKNGSDILNQYNPTKIPGRRFRKSSWSEHLDLFFLDTRSYRDRNITTDHPGKTMLGKKQLAWLKHSLADSTATWKVIVSSVPISSPTGYPVKNGRDGWANYDNDTGFEHELTGIFNFLKNNKINNTIWLTTDVHFAQTIRYRPFPSDSKFQIYEFTAGPISARFFPNKDLDATYYPERLFYFGPDSLDSVKSYDEAVKWFNFGIINISSSGELKYQIYNGYNENVYTLALPKNH